MKRKLIAFLVLSTIALFSYYIGRSTTDENVIIANNIRVFNEVQHNMLIRDLSSEEQLSIMEEHSEDKSNPDFRKKMLKLMSFIDDIEKTMSLGIQEIDELKIELLKSAGEKVYSKNNEIIKRYPDKNSPFITLLIDPSKIKNPLDYKSVDNIMFGNKNSARKILLSKNKICVKLAQKLEGSVSHDFSDKLFYFNPPNLHSFRNQKELEIKVRSAIKKSNVNADDQEMIVSIYDVLYSSEMIHGKHWENYTFEGLSLIDALTNLTIIQRQLFEARTNFLMAISYRVAFCGCTMFDYSQTRPIVDAPGVVKKGDSIEVRVFIATAKNYPQNQIKLSSGQQNKVLLDKNGMQYIKLKADKSKEINLSGSYTIFNYAGIPRTYPWKKKVYVLD